LSDKELETLYHRFQALAESAAKLEHGAKVSVEAAGAGLEEKKRRVPAKREAQGRKEPAKPTTILTEAT
jgi:hypothetical protein